MPLQPMNLQVPFKKEFFENLATAFNQLEILNALRGSLVWLTYHQPMTGQEITVSGKIGTVTLSSIEVLEKTRWIFSKCHLIPLTWVRELTTIPPHQKCHCTDILSGPKA